MANRLIASVLALVTVLGFVFIELALSYSGVFGLRDNVYNWAYETLSNGGMATSVIDSALTTAVYTLPEATAVLILYHTYSMLGMSMGWARDAGRSDHPSHHA